MNKREVSLETQSREGRYVSDLSHELRGPLTILDVRLQLLAGSAPREIADEVSSIADDVRDLVSVINDVLLLSREDRLMSSGVCRADEVVRDTLGAMSLLPGMPRLVSRARDRGGYRVAMSATSLRRCLAALIDNAAKHSSAGDQITIRLSSGEQHVFVDVCDDGPGVDPLVLARIFEREVSGSAESGSRQNFGIGLALVRETLNRHHGSIHVAETGSNGTTFRITLPKPAT